jgi:hypothetical protein
LISHGFSYVFCEALHGCSLFSFIAFQLHPFHLLWWIVGHIEIAFMILDVGSRIESRLHAAELHPNCTRTAPTLYQNCITGTAPPELFQNLRQKDTNIVPEQNCTRILGRLPRGLTRTARELLQNSNTRTAPESRQNCTRIVPELHQTCYSTTTH